MSEVNKKWLPLTLGLILVLLVSTLSVGTAQTGSLVSLGTWLNYPCGQINCACSLSSPQDPCELFNQVVYRKTLISAGASQLLSQLQVNCVSPASVGSEIDLFYANYSEVTHTNITNFVLVHSGADVKIDNSPNWPCPGTLTELGDDPLPTLPGGTTDYIFRAIGLNGGGGTSVQLSSVSVGIIKSIERLASVVIATRSTTNFNAFVYVNVGVTASTVENFDWIATNSTALIATSTQHGSATCTIPTGGISCSVVTTFTTPFIGTPSVVGTSRNAGTAANFPIGEITLFDTHAILA